MEGINGGQETYGGRFYFGYHLGDCFSLSGIIYVGCVSLAKDTAK